MGSAAAEVAVSIQDEFKLVIVAGINRRLSAARAKHDTWAQVAAELDWSEDYLSKLRTQRVQYFSLSKLIDIADQLGVELTLTAV
jgi:hypothetical protein